MSDPEGPRPREARIDQIRAAVEVRDQVRTHWEGCEIDPGHRDCAIRYLLSRCAALEQERDAARLDVTRMAQAKIGEKCRHHRESLVCLEFLALRECPICWMEAARNSEALYRTEKANAEAAESRSAALRHGLEQLIASWAAQAAVADENFYNLDSEHSGADLTGCVDDVRALLAAQREPEQPFLTCPKCGVVQPCFAHPESKQAPSPSEPEPRR